MGSNTDTDNQGYIVTAAYGLSAYAAPSFVLRHEVYCVQRKWLDASTSMMEIEPRADAESTHLFIRNPGEFSAVASVRLTATMARPIDAVAPKFAHWGDHEIGRFCVAKNSAKTSPTPLVAELFKLLYQHSRRNEIDGWCGVISPGVLEILHRNGVDFCEVGDTVLYHGKRVLVRGNPLKIAERMAKKNQKGFDRMRIGDEPF